MALKQGVSKMMRDLVSAGHDPKDAVAMAISSARKMAMGGEVESDVDGNDEMNRDLAELNDDSQPPDQVANPEENKEAMSFAMALRKQAESVMNPESYAMGGLVEDEFEDQAQGNIPEVQSGPESEEPMSMMRKSSMDSPVPMSSPGLSEAQAMAIMEKKKKRKYA